MYDFRDTIGASDGAVLPSEALKINGEYIENQITGYRTLNVRGREALSKEVTYQETGARDGASIVNGRYPTRDIIVTYQLAAASNEAFRDAFNKLGQILNVTDAELIFNDEPDKFFIGTPTEFGDVAPGSNIVVGEFRLTCADPFKYSVDEYEVAPTETEDGLVFITDYKGTYKSFPTFETEFYSELETDGETENELTGDGDCGFVAFFNEQEKIIQLGNPGESDGEDLAKSQTLTTQSFNSSTAWSSACKKRWVSNVGVVAGTGTLVQNGTMGLGKPAPSMFPNERYLTATNYGSGTHYHGASVTRTLPADAAGVVGATNWTLSYKQKLSIGSETSGAGGKNAKLQRGLFQANVIGENGKIIASVCIFKTSTGTKGTLRLRVNGKVMKSREIDLSAYNKYFGSNTYKNGKLVKKTVKSSSIKKDGSKITFNIGGIVETWTVPAIADLVATKVTFIFCGHSTKPAFKYNGIYSAKFVKNNCDTWKEVPNKFSTDDVCVCDCRTGEISLNDAPAPELGALGNDYEEFYLQPGTNQIGVAYSDWVTAENAPTFKMKYREVFI